MELIALKTLVALVDENGIKGASEKLHTVQSNITSRIQRLEEELGTALFQRQGRKLVLTESGKTLYDYARNMLLLEQQAVQAVKQSADSYDLIIGTPETFAAVHLPKALHALHQQHSHIHPIIRTGTSAELTAGVLAKRFDCGFVGGSVRHPDLVALPAVTESMVHVTAKKPKDESTLFIREEGCAYRKHALDWQQGMGLGDQARMVMASADGILGCIAAGLGYTVISEEMIIGSRYEELLKMTPLQGPSRTLNISLIYHKESLLKAGIHTLAELFNPPNR